MKKTYPTILAIDTSCDDTSVAVTQGMRVLSNAVASQIEIHRKYGGVMPLEAKLAHHTLINPTYHEVLVRARIKPEDIDIIAVTQGPGLAIALEVGIEFAKNLSTELKKPLIAVNHMQGHLFSSLAVNREGDMTAYIPENNFPAIALLVSGGHTDLILLNDIEHFNIIGKTVDDAAGECLDKFARIIDLGYPGASAMEIIAREGDNSRFLFPIPMTQTQNLNFSFSGLKTSGRHKIEELGELSKQDVRNLAASFQMAVFKAILYKLKKAVTIYKPNSLWLGGGVSNNVLLKKLLRSFCKEKGMLFRYPYSNKLMGDNAAMIGVAAYFNYLKKDFIEDFDQFQRVPRLPL